MFLAALSESILPFIVRNNEMEIDGNISIWKGALIIITFLSYNYVPPLITRMSRIKEGPDIYVILPTISQQRIVEDFVCANHFALLHTKTFLKRCLLWNENGSNDFLFE